MNGDRIRQVRELLGLSQERFGELVGLTQGAIAQLESGRVKASQEVEKAVALRTGFALDFYSGREPDLPFGSILYRCRRSVKKMGKAYAHRYAQIACEVAITLMGRLKEIPVAIPSGLSGDPVAAASIARSAIGLSPEAPIPDLIAALERSGVIVVTLPVAIDGLDGFSTWVQTETTKRPLIVLGKQVPGYRTRFTVGEEYGHLVMHTPLSVSTAEADKQARLFSGELLFPGDAVIRELDQPVTLAGLARIKHRWKMAISALLHRALDAGIVDPNQYRYLNYQITVRGWKKGEPGDEKVVPESPRLLARMAQVSYGEQCAKRLRDELGIPMYILRPLVDPESYERGASIVSMKSSR